MRRLCMLFVVACGRSDKPPDKATVEKPAAEPRVKPVMKHAWLPPELAWATLGVTTVDDAKKHYAGAEIREYRDRALGGKMESRLTGTRSNLEGVPGVQLEVRVTGAGGQVTYTLWFTTAYGVSEPRLVRFQASSANDFKPDPCDLVAPLKSVKELEHVSNHMCTYSETEWLSSYCFGSEDGQWGVQAFCDRQVQGFHTAAFELDLSQDGMPHE